MLGVPVDKVFETLQVYLGSAYVNDFNLLGRTLRVTAQADAPFRDDAGDIAQLKTRSRSGDMVPIGSVATFEDKTGPYRVIRYNLFPAVEVDGDTAPRFSSGHSIATMEKISTSLPAGFSTEWTGIAFQEKAAGNVAILIVEFAKQAEERGATAIEAAVEAARTRLRPIVMTSLAFILRTMPLVFATGPGAELRQALGTAVFFGMIGVTAFGLPFTPLFYTVCRSLGNRLRRRTGLSPASAGRVGRRAVQQG